MKLNVVNSKKKIKWVSTIRNYNKFSMKLSKYIGWKRLSEKNSCTKIIKKYYNINKGLVYYGCKKFWYLLCDESLKSKTSSCNHRFSPICRSH